MNAKTPLAAIWIVVVGCAENRHDAPYAGVAEVPPMIGGTSVMRHTFDLRNSTSETVTVLELAKSCSCTEVRLDGHPVVPGIELLSGRRAALEMTIRTEGRDGPVSAHCSVINSAGLNWSYRLSGFVHAPVKLEPERLSIGRIPAGETGSQGFVVRLTHARGETPVLEFAPSTDEVTVRVLESSSIDVSAKIQQTVTRAVLDVSAGAVYAAERAVVSVSLAGEDAPGAAELDVDWSVAGPYQPQPSTAFIGLLPGDDGPAECSMLITRGDGRPFRILDARCAELDLEFQFSTEAADEQTLDLKLRDTEIAPGASFGIVNVVARADSDVAFGIRCHVLKGRPQTESAQPADGNLR